MLQQVLERYQQLNEREKPLVLSGLILVILALFYVVIWQPLNDNLQAAQKGVAAQQETLNWLQQNIARVKLAQSGNTSNKFRGSLTQLVSSTSSRNNLKVARLQPSNNSLQVWLEDAPFNDLLSWLNGLQAQGVVIENLDLAAANAPGMVKVRRLQLAN